MLQTIVIPEKAASDDLIAWHILQEAKLKSVFFDQMSPRYHKLNISICDICTDVLCLYMLQDVTSPPVFLSLPSQ